MNTGRRKGPRNSGGGRGGRQRQNIDKAIYNDGVYANPRFINATLSIIGCEVQVQVRNGCSYEGIFKTFSPKMEIVLEMAHKVDDINKRVVPSRDRLIEKLIFRCADVVSIQARSVDLDYASKDTFTDSAISGKFNGPTSEKELQPWDSGETGSGMMLEEIETNNPVSSGNNTTTSTGEPNGWDVQDMFKINEMRFNVQSSYDPTLSGYTTQLKPENTKEYRDREAQAARLAKEIERSESYMAHIQLENGEGDEEDKFSAVVRPSDNNNAPGSGGKYVPPHMRGKSTGVNSGGGGGSNRPARPGPPPNTTGPPPQPTRPRESPSPGHNVNAAMPNNHDNHASPSPPVIHHQDSREEPKVNGDPEVRVDEPVLQEEPVQEASPAAVGYVDSNMNKEGLVEQNASLTMPGRHEPRKPTKNREEEIEDLKNFGSTFKLSPEKDRKSQVSGAPTLQPHVPPPQMMPPPAQPLQSSPQSVPATSPSGEKQEPEKPAPEEKKEKDGVEKNLEETVKKSTLNPNAKEFVMNPNAKVFTPKQAQPPPMSQPQPVPVATPPRPQTQSPVIVPTMPPMQNPPLYQGYPPMAASMAMQGVPQQQPQQYPKGPRKTAVVSIGPRQVQPSEYNPAAQAAAATGQPIIAPQQPQYALQYMPPQVQGHIPQMMPMQAGTRMMAPHTAQATHQLQEQSQSQGQMYVPGPGATAVPAHLGGHIPNHGQGGGHGSHTGPPIPAHMAPHHQPTPPHSQPSHINNQSGGAHPAPSPVQQHHPHPGQHPGQHPAAQHPHPSQHPGSQGGPPGHPGHPPVASTPQLMMYPHSQQMGPQPGPQHPPLQPSPHTPTSPQSMYPMSYPYSYSTQAGMTPMQPVTLTQASQHTGAHSHPHAQQQSHMPPPGQVVMVQSAQQMHGQQQQQMHQHQLHQHHMQGPAPPLLPQQQAGAINSTNQMPPQHQHPQMHYVPPSPKFITMQQLP